MGLFTGDFRFLLSAKCMGLGGGDACTISRQPLFFSEETMNKIAREFGQDLSSLPRGQAIYLTDDVLRALGFEQVDVLDISSYEGANIIQDLNRPVPPQLHEKYSLVVDGGTLEHVFNFPLAIENIMRMVKVGGDVWPAPGLDDIDLGKSRLPLELHRAYITDHRVPAFRNPTISYPTTGSSILGD